MCHFRCPWNDMFDCHRTETTVMQFIGHSLPVHQSMTVPQDFTLSQIVSPSSPTPMEYATSASLEWHVWPGRRPIYHNCLKYHESSRGRSEFKISLRLPFFFFFCKRHSKSPCTKLYISCIDLVMSIIKLTQIQIQAGSVVSDANGFFKFCLRSLVTRGDIILKSPC